MPRLSKTRKSKQCLFQSWNWLRNRTVGWRSTLWILDYHYDNDGPRTTNNVEGWHSNINMICKTAHPNIYTMVKMLQNIQSTNEAKLIQLSAGGKQRTKKRKYRQLHFGLQQLQTRLRNGTLNVEDFADTWSHLLYLDCL